MKILLLSTVFLLTCSTIGRCAESDCPMVVTDPKYSDFVWDARHPSERQDTGSVRRAKKERENRSSTEDFFSEISP